MRPNGGDGNAIGEQAIKMNPLLESGERFWTMKTGGEENGNCSEKILKEKNPEEIVCD